MELLEPLPADEAPADYLYARIRSRRSRLDIDGADQRSASGDPRKLLRDQYHWLYLRLNRRLRSQLRPVFEYEELRSLVLALRHLAVRDRSALAEILNGSLLNRTLCRALSGSERVATAVAALERLLAEEYPFCRDLAEIYLKQGPGGLEQAMNSGFLQQTVGSVSPSAVRLYFRYLVDMRNLLALYKHLHWKLPLPPPLIKGGEIGLNHFQRIWAERDPSGLAPLVRKLTGLDDDPLRDGFEEVLCRGLAERLRLMGRDPLQIGVLLDYLWRCRMAARNRGLRGNRRRTPQEQELML